MLVVPFVGPSVGPLQLFLIANFAVSRLAETDYSLIEKGSIEICKYLPNVSFI